MGDQSTHPMCTLPQTWRLSAAAQTAVKTRMSVQVFYGWSLGISCGVLGSSATGGMVAWAAGADALLQ